MGTDVAKKLQQSGVLVASGNQKKLKELQRILEDLNIRVLPPDQVGYRPDVEETEDTFEGNAKLKALAALGETGIPTIADDSGLMVDALNGEPGVYSARYGGEGLSDPERNALVLQKLKSVPFEQRTARFVSVICLALPDGRSFLFRGEVEGKILDREIGDGGFGYDPIFYHEESQRGFATLDPSQKDQLSHRGNALRKLKEFLKQDESLN